jgi:hypothetical protein
MDFEFDEVGLEGFTCELCGQHCFVGITYSRCVGEQLHAFAHNVHQHIVLAVAHVDAFHGHCDHLRP